LKVCRVVFLKAVELGAEISYDKQVLGFIRNEIKELQVIKPCLIKRKTLVLKLMLNRDKISRPFGKVPKGVVREIIAYL
jgi:hypothetical protein